MARSKRSPARLVVALSVAALLAVFLLYTAVLGSSSTPSVQPSELAGQTETLSLTGKVVGPITGDAHAPGGLRFTLRDINPPAGGKAATVPIVYHGSVPDMFKAGRDINATGKLEDGSFAATAMTTKCPSKYTDKKA
jgi:cytochrome c-type biogenesis protein CcmE